MVNALFIDGPQHGRFMRNIGWPGLYVLFPVMPEITLIQLPADEMPPMPKTANYRMWATIVTTIIYKFEGIR